MTFTNRSIAVVLLLAFAATSARAGDVRSELKTAADARDAMAKFSRGAGSPPSVGSPVALAITQAIERGAGDESDAAAADRLALDTFYRSRSMAPLWVTSTGVTDKGRALVSEIRNAAAYGLDPRAFDVPDFDAVAGDEALGAADYQLSLAALTYARHARGGRIPDLAAMLNSNLDRKPQLHKPEEVLARLAGAQDVAAALTALHPVHPQFEKLRQAFLKKTRDRKGGGKLSFAAKRLRANMEFWRWMWDDLGELYVFNNLPEYMQYVVKDGEVVRTERIVVGELDKQSSVFSRPLNSVVLRPRWRVPESIMVRELWPSLRRGGGLMRRHRLEITTKSGEKRNWRTIDWTKDDIRNYHVWQAPGRHSSMGNVKFSFPSQHTIFMHDTPDKWMFKRRTRTLSHGCLRVRNPLELAEIILAYDRGWDMAKIKSLLKSGPPDNVIRMEKHIPIHLAYFTAWVDDNGKLKMFRDIYGHEKRVRQALDGNWDEINKGRNHLAPPKPQFHRQRPASGAYAQRRKRGQSVGSIIGNALGAAF